MKYYLSYAKQFFLFILIFSAVQISIGYFLKPEVMIYIDCVLLGGATVYAQSKVLAKRLTMLAGLLFFASKLAFYQSLHTLDTVLSITFLIMVAVIVHSESKAQLNWELDEEE